MTLVLSGCDTFKDKVPLTGKRESVLSIEASLTPDYALQGTPVFLPAQVRNKDWPQAGQNPSHIASHFALDDHLEQAWVTNIGYGASDEHRLTAGPVVGGGLVYVCDALGHITAVNVTDGAVVWSMNPYQEERNASESIGGGVAYDSGMLFCATAFGDLVALQAKDGKVVWRKPLGAPSRVAPTIKDGKVYALTINNETHVFSAMTGDSLWNHAGISEAAGILGGASPAVAEGIVISAYSSGEIFAFEANTGQPIWGELLNPALRIDSVASIAHVRARPAIIGGVVYIVSHGGQMVALDTKVGQRLWQREIAGIRSPAVIGDSIFMVTNDGDLVCLQKATGQIHWAVPLPRVNEDKKPILWAGPIIAGNSVILTSSNGQILFASPQDGKTQKTLAIPEGSSISPVIADGALYVLTDEGNLVKYQKPS